MTELGKRPREPNRLEIYLAWSRKCKGFCKTHLFCEINALYCYIREIILQSILRFFQLKIAYKTSQSSK